MLAHAKILPNESKEVTLTYVRDEIERCFIDAHGSDEMGSAILRQQYKKAGVDYDSPSKADLKKVMTNLATLSTSFRNEEEIRSNFQKIQKILNRCQCD